jgi:hypothetical protein
VGYFEVDDDYLGTYVTPKCHFWRLSLYSNRILTRIVCIPFASLGDKFMTINEHQRG